MPPGAAVQIVFTVRRFPVFPERPAAGLLDLCHKNACTLACAGSAELLPEHAPAGPSWQQVSRRGPMGTAVEGICEALERNQFMTPEDVAALRRRWFRPTREGVTDVERFRKWLVSNHFVTAHQAALLVRGEVDKLQLDQYRLIDRVKKGCFAGAYKAVDAQGQAVLVRIVPASKWHAPDAVSRFEREAQLALR